MSNFFYDIVTDAINYDDEEKKAELYALTLLGMETWCCVQMHDAGVPLQFINYTVNDLFAGDSDFGYKLWRYIQDTCAPEKEIIFSLQHTAHASAPLPSPSS